MRIYHGNIYIGPWIWINDEVKLRNILRTYAVIELWIWQQKFLIYTSMFGILKARKHFCDETYLIFIRKIVLFFCSEIPHSSTQSNKKYFFFFQKQFTSFLFFFSSFKYNLHAMFCHIDKYHTVNWINDNYINLARKLYNNLFHGMNETKLYLCCSYSHLQ